MEDDHLDPRIHIELEKLNNATNNINQLEKELDDSQAEFRTHLSTKTAELNKLIQKYGASGTNSIELSRPFISAMKDAKQAHLRLHEITIQYQRANELFEEAKMRVHVTEEKLKYDSGFDDGLPDVLNRLNELNVSVSESSKSKEELSELHKRLTDEFTRCEKNVYNLEKKLYKHIQKSQHYFELKDQLNEELTNIKNRIQSIQSNLIQSKCDYSNSLKKLEQISEQIHLQRKAQQNNNCNEDDD